MVSFGIGTGVVDSEELSIEKELIVEVLKEFKYWLVFSTVASVYPKAM